MTELIITRGLPGSGKTTFRDHYTNINPERHVGLSRDDIRVQMVGKRDRVEREVEEWITSVHRNAVKLLLGNDKNVVVDDTNYRDRTCREWRDLANECGASFRIEDFRGVSLETCLKRNGYRSSTGGHHVPEQYIVDSYNRFILGRDLSAPLDPNPVQPKGEDYQEVVPYVPDPSLPPAFIVDVDGTLAKCGDRDIYDASKAHLDTVVEPVRAVVSTLYSHGTYDIIVLTGRQARHGDVTREWLLNNDVSYDLMLTRADGDTRPDWVVKQEILHRDIAPHYNVIGVIDDRPSVCRMWRKAGLFTFQVGDPHVEF